MPEDDGPPESSPSVQRELQQAAQALTDAKTGQAAGLSDAAVVNRLYYAAFHAAQAVLYDRGHNPTSHGGVISLFGSEIVVDGEVSREQGRFLNRLSELRKQADYGYEAIAEDIEELLERTEQFVTEMETLCTDQDEP
ncbi:HEPN domain-containing protein [Halosimplex aquaticum]|uniref:HEPN domain-containing protein n=1 Tax=Halosimplex aquaticum TaxID=3026162 RepID=A0ABD5XXT7_9EURY|nr:HEPN domain-containing protein [Halosimplex aquaticum]